MEARSFSFEGEAHAREQQQDLLAVASVSTGDGDAALARMLASPEQQRRLLDTGSVGGQSLLVTGASY